jgi:hypothetical protein
MLGRMMGLMMFAVVGLTPVSTAAAGALIQVNATAVLIGAGILMMLVVTIGALSPSVWRLGDEASDAERQLGALPDLLEQPLHQAA